MPNAESSHRTLRFGAFEVDLEAAELRKHGIRIKLQEQQYQILVLLLQHPEGLVTREELRKRLWPGHTFVDFDRSLNKAMTKLRSALSDSAESPRYIETLHRRGYRFLAPVQAGVSLEMMQQSAVSAPSRDGNGSQATPKNGKALSPKLNSRMQPETFLPKSSRKRVYLLASAALLLFSAGGLSYLRIYHPIVLGGSLHVRRSVAVLGFRNLSGDPHQAWLSTALSDWLITELSAGQQIRTIPAESVARMKRELSLPEIDSLDQDSLGRIRRNLGTDLVVAGAYAMSADQVNGQIRFDLRLQDTRSGDTLDAITETGNESDLFDLVSRAGQQLREKLGIAAVTQKEAAEVATALPSNPEATRYYSEGLAKLRVSDALAGRDLLLGSIAAEPNFALAHSALANAWAQLGYDERAQNEAKQAYELSANLPRAERLLVDGQYRELSGDWANAIQIYRALFEFYPDNLDYGLALAHAEVSAGKGGDALNTVAALRVLPEPLRADPRIDLAEDRAAESVGDFKRDLASASKAAEKAKISGASSLLAKALLDQAWANENLGGLDNVDNLVREAKRFYAGTHDQKGIADAETDGAIALEFEGNYLGAKSGYEEALAIDEKLGSKLATAAEHDNIGDVLYFLGDLKGAQQSYERALATYREVDHDDGVALAQTGLGLVALARGDHFQAKGMFENSLRVCRHVGDRSKEAAALTGLADALHVEGNLPEAQKDEEQAVAVFEGIGDQSSAAKSQLGLAELLLDEGSISPSAMLAQKAADVFQATRSVNDRAAAELILSRALLAQGKFADAQRQVADAVTVAETSRNLDLGVRAEITAARIQAASGKPADTEGAKKRIDIVIARAESSGLFNDLLEARLALGEIEVSTDKFKTGRADLENLEKDATKDGFLLIARKAAADLRTRREVVSAGGKTLH